MHYLVISVAGLFVFNEDDKLIKFKSFKKDPQEIAEILLNRESPEIEDLKKEYEDLVIKQPNKATKYFRENFRKLVLETKFVENEKELNKILNEIGIAQAIKQISKLERRDKLIIQTVSALNDLDKILNFMSERLREWYGLHYPELDIKDHEKFASKIAEFGARQNFKEFSKSMGMELKKDDVEVLQSYAKGLEELYRIKGEITKYLEKIVPEEVPNINALLGSILAARLLTLAGSLERLAKMPSSTVQLLGAEKSLFKYLKGREVKRPPKFGLIFLHPDISNSKKEFQGKIARLLSSKIALAARADFYTKKDMSQELLEDYKEKLKKILSG